MNFLTISSKGETARFYHQEYDLIPKTVPPCRFCIGRLPKLLEHEGLIAEKVNNAA